MLSGNTSKFRSVTFLNSWACFYLFFLKFSLVRCSDIRLYTNIQGQHNIGVNFNGDIPAHLNHTNNLAFASNDYLTDRNAAIVSLFHCSTYLNNGSAEQLGKLNEYQTDRHQQYEYIYIYNNK